jgi:hypothetical protein
LKKYAGAGLSKVKNGFNVGTKGYRGAYITKFFGCLKCPSAGNESCPHKIPMGGHHSNWICSDRVMYLKEKYQQAGDLPKIYQQETLFSLGQIMENMLSTYSEEGELDTEFRHIARLVINLTDKMRRQDEGVKIQGELTVSHQDFKNLVETEAKKIEERDNNIRPAEFTEEVSDSRPKE